VRRVSMAESVTSPPSPDTSALAPALPAPVGSERRAEVRPNPRATQTTNVKHRQQKGIDR
jgi:hypothetical protein